jgi:hypothetical protein
MSRKLESEMMRVLGDNLKNLQFRYEEGLITFQETMFGMMAAMQQGFEYALAEQVKDEIDEVAREMLGMPSHFEEWKNRMEASFSPSVTRIFEKLQTEV